MGASATARPTGKHAPSSGDALFNIKHMTSELPKVSIFCHFKKYPPGLPDIFSRDLVKQNKIHP